MTELEDNDIAIRAYDIAPTDSMRERARTLDVTLHDDISEAVNGASLILSAVTTENCVAAAQLCAPALTPDHIWYDLNSTSPVAKRAAAEFIIPSGARYTDTAVMSDIPRPRHKAPLLLAGVDAEDSASRLQAIGMNATPVGVEVGQAATVKMCRSVFLKGFDAVLFECLAAASEVGVRDQVISSIHDTFPEFNIPTIAGPKMNRLAQHCKRRAGEMRYVHETLEDLGVDPITPTTTSRVLERMSDAGCAELADPAAGELDELTGTPFVADWLDRTNLPSGGRALDVACGLGRNARFLASRGLQVEGQDISSVALEQARKLAEAEDLDINFVQTDFDSDKPSANTFDLIVVARFINRNLNQHLAGMLKPGGWLLYEHHLKTDWEVSGPKDPAFRLDPNELLTLCQPLRVVFFQEVIDVDPDGRTMALARIAARNDL